MRYIGLMDCNNFFVSCERLFRPDLRTKPVVVLSSNDGCVVARSQEVKDMGIPMGAPLFKVKKELDAAKTVIFSSNFTLYRDISARVMRVLRAEVADTEQYSIDEAFFTLAPELATEAELRRIKAIVEQKVGVPVSLGLGASKTLSKVANHTAKKGDGAFVLEADVWQERSNSMHISELWGVGRGLSAQFADEGIETPAGLMAADSARVAARYGVAGTRLQSELLGKPAFPFHATRELQQSIMSTRSFGAETSELAALERALAHHIEHAAAELREMGGVARIVRILARPSRFSDYAFRGIGEEVVLSESTDDTRELLGVALARLRARFEPEVPYKKAGVVLAGITHKGSATPSLFARPDGSALMATIDAINQRFGKGQITFMSAGQDRTLVRKNCRSGAPTTRWSDIPTVKAN